jgi:hypothetical protein
VTPDIVVGRAGKPPEEYWHTAPPEIELDELVTAADVEA